MQCPNCGKKISTYTKSHIDYRDRHRKEYNDYMREYRKKNREKINARRREKRKIK
jgi:hypothetical protein